MAEGTGRAARRFEELQVYQRARELTNARYRLSGGGAFRRDRGLCDQIRRASVSIMSNIAEGFERGTKTEFIQFLYVAKGSLGEVRAQLQIATDQDYLTQADFDRMYQVALRVSRMLSHFIAHLQTSAYEGEKTHRPRRQARLAHEQRRQALQAAQEVNMRSPHELLKKDHAS